jgi:hypothetical protein
MAEANLVPRSGQGEVLHPTAQRRSTNEARRRKMDADNEQPPLLWRIVPDVVAFALGLGVTWMFGWHTGDLVWSLWLSSLVIGYLTIVSTIGAGLYLGGALVLQGDIPVQRRPTVILIGLAVALFFFAFFSFHFCAFHAAHASFLTSFFPLEGLPRNSFSGAFTNPILLWKTAVRDLFPAYGAFLIPAIVAERRYVFASAMGAVRIARAETGEMPLAGLWRPGQDRRQALSEPFSRPYINVVRMHLLIFFFAACHALKIESFFVFATVYFVYFFPWRTCRDGWRRRDAIAPSSSA